jgi:hypothetical protein
VARSGPTKRLLTALARLRSLDRAGSPLDPVAFARRIREAAEDLEAAKIEAARASGVSWREIGIVYGMSKQAAQQRFGRRSPSGGRSPESDRRSTSAAPRRGGKGTEDRTAVRSKRSQRSSTTKGKA